MPAQHRAQPFFAIVLMDEDGEFHRVRRHGAEDRVRHHLAALPSQQRLGLLLQPVEPVGDAGDVRRRDALGYTFGLETLVHLDERPKIFPAKRANLQFPTLMGLNRDRFERDLQSVSSS